MVALAPYIVPTTLLLFVGTSPQQEGGHPSLERVQDVETIVQAYAADSSSTYSNSPPLVDVPLEAHKDVLRLAVQLAQDQRNDDAGPPKGELVLRFPRTNMAAEDAAEPDWVRAHRPRRTEREADDPAKVEYDGERSTRATTQRAGGKLTFEVSGVCRGERSAGEVAELVWQPVVQRKRKKRAGGGDKLLLSLRIDCALDTDGWEEAEDRWGFQPDTDGGGGNAWTEETETADMEDRAEEKGEDDRVVTTAAPHIPPVQVFWGEPAEGGVVWAERGTVPPKAMAYLPVTPVLRALYGDKHAGWKENFGPGSTFGSGAELVSGRDYADMLMLEDGALAEKQFPQQGRKPAVRLVRADVLRAFLQRPGATKLRGLDLGLPTRMRACAQSLDAECLCEEHDRALQRAGRLRASAETNRLASGLACCMPAGDYVKSFAAATSRTASKGREWCDAGLGQCGLPTDCAVEELVPDDSRCGTAADGVTPWVEVQRVLKEEYFDKYSTECPWEGSTVDGRAFELRIWRKPYSQICQEYVEDYSGRRDGMSLSCCKAYALELKATYRYLRGAKCMCSDCHLAEEMAQEFNDHFAQESEKAVTMRFEGYVNRFPHTLKDADLDVLRSEDSLLRQGRAPQAAAATAAAEAQTPGPDAPRTVLLAVDGLLGHRGSGGRLTPRPQAGQIVSDIMAAGIQVSLFECDGVTTGELEALGLSGTPGLGVEPAGRCVSKAPRRSLEDWRRDLEHVPTAVAGQVYIRSVESECFGEPDGCTVVAKWRKGMRASKADEQAAQIVAAAKGEGPEQSDLVWSFDGRALEVAADGQLSDVPEARRAAFGPAALWGDPDGNGHGSVDNRRRAKWSGLQLAAELLAGDLDLSATADADDVVEAVIEHLAPSDATALTRRTQRLEDAVSVALGEDDGPTELGDAFATYMADEGFGLRGGIVEIVDGTEGMAEALAPLLEYATVPVAAVIAPSSGGQTATITIDSAGFCHLVELEHGRFVRAGSFGSLRVGRNFHALAAALDGWYGADASEIAIFVRGRAHTMGSVAPIEMSMGHDGRIEADISGALPYLEFEAVLDAAEGRVCGGAQEGSGLCQRLATIRTHLLHDHVAHKIDTVYQNARLADHRRSVTETRVVAEGDYKQNLECVASCRQKQSDYFCIPTCAFHSFVFYTANGPIRYRDTWSLSKTKNACWMSHAWRDVFARERQTGGLLDGVTHIDFWSDNGPPYHSGEWILEALGITDVYGGDFHPSGLSYTINFNTPGEGKGGCDAHFSKVSQCKRQWTDKEHRQLTAENLPEFMSYLEECVQNTVVLELPNDHASTCPTEGEFSKIKDVKSYMQFFVRDNQAYARAYSDIGDGEAVTIVKGKRQATELRSGNFDAMREAMIDAVGWHVTDSGMSEVWKAAAERRNAPASTGYGLTACSRFIVVSGAKSPFRTAGWLCYDEALADLKRWVAHARYDTDGVRWKPAGSSTVHSIAKKLGAMELCRLGALQVPALESCGAKVEPTPAHIEMWRQLKGAGEEQPQCPVDSGAGGDGGSGGGGADGSTCTASGCAPVASVAAGEDRSTCPDAIAPEDAAAHEALDEANGE